MKKKEEEEEEEEERRKQEIEFAEGFQRIKNIYFMFLLMYDVCANAKYEFQLLFRPHAR